VRILPLIAKGVGGRSRRKGIPLRAFLRWRKMISFSSIEKHNRCATAGYWLAKSQTGRGLMTAALKALINEGFQRLEVNRIQARVATDNYPSQVVCDRAGLKKEGALRQAEWLYDHYLDMTMNSILRTESNLRD
jgi:ribosomal-protein-serine acetyltransferase